MAAVLVPIIYWLWQHNSVASRAAMLTLTRHLPDAALIVNKEGHIIAYSPAACQLFGYSPDEMVGLDVETLMSKEFAEIHRQKRKGFMKTNRGQAMDNEVSCLNKQGECIPAITRVRTFKLDGEVYAYVSVHDISHFKDREALLKNLSEHDPLTGLANRRLFEHDMEREWHRAMRSNQPLTVLMIDVDHFKQYNDCYGHPAGDTCLKKVAETIRANIQRGTDCVARYGGEEFICLLSSLGVKESLQKAENIRRAVADQSITHTLTANHIVTVSIGVAMAIPQEGVDKESLIAKADMSLYHAKSTGRNLVHMSAEPLAMND